MKKQRPGWAWILVVLAALMVALVAFRARVRMTAQQLGLVILAASEVPNFLSGLLPSLFTIQTFNDDPAKVSALRRGELLGGGMAIAVGFGASLVASTWVPLIACTVILAILIFAYEHAIRTPINGGQSMRQGAA